MVPLIPTPMTERIFRSRPEVMQGRTDSIETPEGTAYVTINYHAGKPTEIFVTLGRSGSTERSMTEAIARLCSISLQHGVPMEVLARQLRGISSEEPLGLGPNKVLSIPDAVGQIMEGHTNGRVQTG